MSTLLTTDDEKYKKKPLLLLFLSLWILFSFQHLDFCSGTWKKRTEKSPGGFLRVGEKIIAFCIVVYIFFAAATLQILLRFDARILVPTPKKVNRHKRQNVYNQKKFISAFLDLLSSSSLVFFDFFLVH